MHIPTPDFCSSLLHSEDRQAIEKIQAAGFAARIVKRDNHSPIVTRDVRGDRINLHVLKGLVIEAFVG